MYTEVAEVQQEQSIFFCELILCADGFFLEADTVLGETRLVLLLQFHSSYLLW